MLIGSIKLYRSVFHGGFDLIVTSRKNNQITCGGNDVFLLYIDCSELSCIIIIIILHPL